MRSRFWWKYARIVKGISQICAYRIDSSLRVLSQRSVTFYFSFLFIYLFIEISLKNF